MSWTMRWANCLLACAMSVGFAADLPAQDHGAPAAHAESAVAEGESAVERAIDPLVVDPNLAIFSLIVFVLLMIILKKFAWGPIIKSLEGREQGIADHLSEAERNHAEAKALLAEYEKKLHGVTAEIRELMDEARRNAEQAKQAILAEAKAGAESERQRALQDIETATDQALKSLAERSAQLAVDLAGKILQTKLSAADHARLIQEAMAKFPESTPSAN